MNQLLNLEAMKCFDAGKYRVEEGCEALIRTGERTESALPGRKCVNKDSNAITVLYTNRNIDTAAGAGHVLTKRGAAASAYVVFRCRLISAMRAASVLPGVLNENTDIAALLSVLTRPCVREAIEETLNGTNPNMETFTGILGEKLKCKLEENGFVLTSIDEVAADLGGERHVE